MQIKKIYSSVYFCLILLPVIFLFYSCSSGTASTKEDETKEKEVLVVKEPLRRMLNYELREREYIRSSGIKAIEKLSFELDNDKRLVPKGKLSTIQYDPSGLTQLNINYDDENNVASRFEYVYTNDGSRTETRRFTPDDELESVYKYEYDTDGFKVKSYRYNVKGDMEKYYLYTYDDNGNLIKDEWFDKSGELEFTIEHKYDSNNLKTETSTFDSGDNLINRSVYRYDSEENIVEEVQYDSNGNQTGLIQYLYTYYH